MAKTGKKLREAAKLIDRTNLYDAKEAIELAKKASTVNFDATVEVAFRLGIDTRKNDQQIRGAVVLPNGTGKTQSVLVFAKGDKLKEAEAAGARSEEHTSELQSRENLVCRLLLEKKNNK